MIITIDGPSVSGKGSVARQLATDLNYYYIDTGLLYRAIGFLAAQQFSGHEVAAGKGLSDQFLADGVAQLRYTYDAVHSRGSIVYEKQDITAQLRTKEIDWYASHISQFANVRYAVLSLQRALGEQHDLVIEGRDCGTVIFPQAPYKFFLVAPLGVRAQRLVNDHTRGNTHYSYQDARRDILQRDIRDISRQLSPLIPAPTARIIDNSSLTLAQTVQCLRTYID